MHNGSPNRPNRLTADRISALVRPAVTPPMSRPPQDPHDWSSISFHCPKCPRPLVYIAPGGRPESHVYGCERHGLWTIGPQVDFRPVERADWRTCHVSDLTWDKFTALSEHVAAINAMVEHLDALTATEDQPDVTPILKLILQELDDAILVFRGPEPYGHNDASCASDP
jgi:hypothetical protein